MIAGWRPPRGWEAGLPSSRHENSGVSALDGAVEREWSATQRVYLERELELQRAQTARIDLLRAQVAECLSDAEAGWQLEDSTLQAQSKLRRQEYKESRHDPTDTPPPYDAPSFAATSSHASASRGTMRAWGPEQPRVWRRRSSEYSSLSADPTAEDIGLQARRRAPRQLNPVLDDLIAEYSREWDIPVEDAEGGIFPEFVDLEVLSDSVLAAKKQERKRLRRQRRRAASEKTQTASRILSKLRLRQTLSKWLAHHRAITETSQRRTRHRVLEQKLRFRLANLAAAGAFSTWKVMIQEILTQRLLLGRALARMRHAHLASAWSTWRSHYRRVQDWHRVLMSIMARLQHSKLAASFTTWRDNSTWQRRARKMGERVAGRLHNMRTSAAFARWALMVVEKKRIKSKVQSAMLRLKNLLLATAWGQWYALVARSLKIRLAGRVIVKRLKNAAVAAAIRQWVSWSRQRKRESRLILKVSGKLKNRTVSAAFTTWSSTARDAVLERQAAARVQKAAGRMIRQWIMRLLSQAMRAWRAATDQILRQRYELTKIALRWHNRQLSNAWLLLREACDTARAEREDEVARAREEARQLAAQEKAVSLLCGRRGLESCRHILMMWLDWAVVSGRLRRLLSKGEGYRRDRVLRDTLQGWSIATADRRALRRLAEKLTGRLSDHAMKSALLQWHRGASMATSKRRAEGKLRKFGLSQATLRSKAVFVGWADLAEHKRVRRQKLSMTLRRAAAGLKGRVWRSWIERTRGMVKNRSVVAESVRKLRLKAAVLCFEMWRALVLMHQVKRAKLRRAVLCFSRTMVAKAFGAWHEHIRIGAQLQKLLGKGTRRQMARQLSRCYAAWVHAVRTLQQYRVVSAKIARKASRGICWDTLYRWYQVAEETARLRRTLHRCSLRLGHVRTGSAFNRWVTVVSVDESKNNAAARFAMGAVSTRSKIVFREWAAVSAVRAEGKRQRERTLNKALQRMMMKSKTLAFECWLELLDAAQQRNERLAKALSRLKNLETAKSFHHWRAILLAVRRRQARAAHAVLVADMRLRLRRCGRSFRPWIGWVRTRKAHRGMVRKGLRKCAQVALQHYIAAWKAYAKQGRHAAAAVRKMLNWHLALSFNAWVQILERKREHFRLLLSAMTHWASGFVARRIFLHWASCVQRAGASFDQPAQEFRSALAGLSPNLAARYRDIVAENEFVQHPAVSPGLRDHSPRPTSPLRHVDTRSSDSDYSLRGSGERTLLLGGSESGSPSKSSLNLQSIGDSSSVGIDSKIASPIADWSLEQLAATASLPQQPSLRYARGQKSPMHPQYGPSTVSDSAHGSLEIDPFRYGISLSSQENRRELSAPGKRVQSVAHLKPRGSSPQQSAPTVMQQSQQPFALPAQFAPSRSSLVSRSHRVQSTGSSLSESESSAGAATRMAVNSSMATTASGASHDGVLPTSAIPMSATAPHLKGAQSTPRLTSAEMWLQQRRSMRLVDEPSSEPVISTRSSQTVVDELYR